MIRHDLPEPVRARVAERLLYDMDPSRTGWVDCTAYAVEAYPGDAPTLSLLLDDGSMFAYAPFHLVVAEGGETGREYALGDLVYRDCPPGPVSACRHALLAALPVAAYLARRREWIGGRYLLSLDFFEANDLLHVLLLDNGRFAALPNHKAKVGAGAPRVLPDYRKLHAEWRSEAGNRAAMARHNLLTHARMGLCDLAGAALARALAGAALALAALDRRAGAIHDGAMPPAADAGGEPPSGAGHG